MADYPWIIEAKKHVGLKEIVGPKHNTTILNWLKELKAWWCEDESAWCGVYVGHCFKACALDIPKYYMRAKAWSDGWGIKIDKPVPGCVVVFERGEGGHVGFVMGLSEKGNLLVLGGNQGNMVKYSPFDEDRVLGYYLPKDYKGVDLNQKLAVIKNNEALSTNEA